MFIYLPTVKMFERLPTFLGHEHCVRLSITNSLTMARYIIDGDLLGVGGLNLNFIILCVYIVNNITIVMFYIRYWLIKSNMKPRNLNEIIRLEMHHSTVKKYAQVYLKCNTHLKQRHLCLGLVFCKYFLVLAFCGWEG